MRADAQQCRLNLLAERRVDAIRGKRGDERHRLGLGNHAEVALLDRSTALQERCRVAGNHRRGPFSLAPFDDLAGAVAARIGRLGGFGRRQLHAEPT